MKLIVSEEGVITVDSKIIKPEDVNALFLEDITNKLLNKEIEVELPEDKSNPVVKLFFDMSELCKEESDFYKAIMTLRKEKKSVEIGEDIENIVDCELE